MQEAKLAPKKEPRAKGCVTGLGRLYYEGSSLNGRGSPTGVETAHHNFLHYWLHYLKGGGSPAGVETACIKALSYALDCLKGGGSPAGVEIPYRKEILTALSRVHMACGARSGLSIQRSLWYC